MISIIIVSKNDRGLEKTLSAIETVIVKPDKIEVIVVDSSRGKLLDIKNRYKKVIWIDYKPVQPITIPHQRNIGLKHAKGEVIVFIDASCSPKKNWLQELYAMYQKGEKIVSGVVIPTDKKVINNISPRVVDNSNYLEECPTSNVLIAKEVFSKIGIFDENFEYGSDSDFTWRAKDAGYKIFYCKQSVVAHDWGGLHAQYKRSYRYGKGRMQLYLKHRHRLNLVLKNDPIIVYYPIFILLLPFSVVFPPILLMAIIPLIKNWNQRPFEVLALNFIYGLGGVAMLVKKTLGIK